VEGRGSDLVIAYLKSRKRSPLGLGVVLLMPCRGIGLKNVDIF
jgi:hypothetical protein